MRITLEEMRHIALLARVGMTDQEIELMRDQMSNILEQFDVLQQVDTEGLEPTGHSVDLQTVMRDDCAQPSVDKAQILSNVPEREHDLIRVKSVLE